MHDYLVTGRASLAGRVLIVYNAYQRPQVSSR
jgi:hypothetical protein